MAKANIVLIEALRKSAQRLHAGAHYAWGHHGACNCGHLLQSLTKLSEGEILRYAHAGVGEWTELGVDYCSSGSGPVALIISKLEEAGLTPTDIHHLEYLSDKDVLNQLPGGFRWLKKNQREDVIVYLEAMANMLEEKLTASISLEELLTPLAKEPVF